MPVDIDVSDVVAAAERAAEELAKLPAHMRAAVMLGAQYERAEKEYTDRTGDARRGTKGRIDHSNAGETVAVLEVDVPYASHLARRGYSEIHEAGRRAGQAIADAIEAIGEKVRK